MIKADKDMSHIKFYSPWRKKKEHKNETEYSVNLDKARGYTIFSLKQFCVLHALNLRIMFHQNKNKLNVCS